MKKVTAGILIGLFFGLLIATAAYSVIKPDVEYNEFEQRELALLPDYAARESLNSWTRGMDAYLLDQFPVRDELINRAHEAEKNSGNSVVQDVYVLDTDYLVGFTYPTEEYSSQLMAEGLKRLSEKASVPVVYSIVPQKNTSISEIIDDLENTTNLLNAERTEKYLTQAGIEYIDVCTYFLENFSAAERGEFYYKTDVHWNDRGGYEAAKDIVSELAGMGYIKEDQSPKKSDFSWVDFTGDKEYMGDLQKRFSEDPYEGEYIPYYELRDKSGLRYYKTLDGDEVPREEIVASGLDEDILHYNAICTYNLGYLRIENDNASSDLKVLVLKDSYQCTMTDYLTAAFAEMDIVDPRNPICSIEEIMDSRDIDLVLCIYHESNVSRELIDYLNK